ncbi:MAG: DUF6252 family protein [Flavobacterium sp.]|nr:DUF6252 family protein [Flavobacterium sp.]
MKFSDPGFQGRKDNYAWRADVTTAHFEATDPATDPSEGYLIISAYKGLEVVSLKMPFRIDQGITKFNPEIFTLGPTADVSDDIFVSYEYEDGGFALVYATDPGEYPDGDSVGNAGITINEYDTTEHTVSGTFKFNAKYTGTSTIVNDNVNFQEGVFYHIPLQ